MIKQVTQQLITLDASIENLQERRYWLQCERAYTYQPIYQTNGRLMAVELLTVVSHPDNPSQLLQLELKGDFFRANNLLASVNVDGPTLIAMRQDPEILKIIEGLPWLRFELVEHIRLPKGSSFASMCEFGPLWLDDFGTGMANFSALSEVNYDYIKVARDLFVMLRKTPEGRNLFTLLLQLMNRYCRGVIVEGVETLEEWRDVQNSPAFAAQGYFLSRPVPLDTLEEVILSL